MTKHQEKTVNSSSESLAYDNPSTEDPAMARVRTRQRLETFISKRLELALDIPSSAYPMIPRVFTRHCLSDCSLDKNTKAPAYKTY